MFRFACPRCKKKLKAPQDRGGSVVACPACKARLKLPVARRMPAAVAARGSGPADEPLEVLPAPPGEDELLEVLSAEMEEEDGDGGPLSAPPAPPVLPENVRAEAARLGDFVAEFPANAGRIGRELWFGTLLLIAALVCAAAGPALAAALAPPERGAGVFLGILVVVLALFVGGWAYRSEALAYRGQRVLLYTDGLLYLNRRGAAGYLWDDVAAVFERVTYHSRRGMSDRATRVYTILRKNGDRAVFNDYVQDVAGFGEALQLQYTNQRLPRALEACRRGGRVEFGILAVGRVGIARGKDSVAWGDFTGVVVSDGRAHLWKRGRWFAWHSASLGDLPNFRLFQALVERLRHGGDC